jgi:NAD+ synthase (glutamine-hydrolysing)
VIEPGGTRPREPYRAIEETESIRRALVLGARDYFSKCGLTRAVVGLSGGIDSAVTLCLAAEALGANNVLGVAMPSPVLVGREPRRRAHTGRQSWRRAARDSDRGRNESLRRRPGSRVRRTAHDVTEENIQARIRGNLLMAISNKFGYLVLSTGNKSELAVGYCTLYGDMSGGLALISDVPKTEVYRIAALCNREREMIPRSTIEKAPSAELRPNQKDVDTLPPYDILDPILDLYLEDGLCADDIVARGYDRKTWSGSCARCA